MTTCAIGVDPGWRWTAGVLRVDDRAINGFTLGPVDLAGKPSRKANDGMDTAAMYAYTRRIGQYLDQLYDEAVELGYGRPLLGVEMPSAPGSSKRYVTGLRAFLITDRVAYFSLGRYDGFPFPADGNGNRHYTAHGGNGDMADYYPAELRRRRPSGWLRNEEPRTSRDHERAAYDIAGRVLELNVSRETAAA